MLDTWPVSGWVPFNVFKALLSFLSGDTTRSMSDPAKWNGGLVSETDPVEGPPKKVSWSHLNRSRCPVIGRSAVANPSLDSHDYFSLK